MKRSLAILAAGATIAAAPALAGTLEQPAPEAPVAPAEPLDLSPDWTGFYGGAQLGFGDVDSNLPGVSGDDVIGGLTVGYDHDFGNWVAGGALDIDWADINIAPGVNVDQVFRAKLRGGYKIGRGLLYATGGFANIDTSGLGDDDGYFIGGGYEHMVTDNISVGGEVLYHEVETFGATAADIEATTVQLRATYRF